ncbi:MAG: hypothetical protein KDJ19_00800 [Hyphomicrobiaceae bacterium]|nr:hypothetical protein [Hyphomicrobiaceae bacterium]MCC0024647.1 hypothetical protein [Hyphomicrobiaceae bacterium]
MKFWNASIVLLPLVLAGCATRPADIAPSYVSSSKYDGMSCSQLEREAEGISRAAVAAAGAQEQAAQHDAAMTTVGVVLFWPAIFFNKGDGASAAEVARLKGEILAIQQASDTKHCNISIQQI